jgi:hypothetical protein
MKTIATHLAKQDEGHLGHYEGSRSNARNLIEKSKPLGANNDINIK